MFILFTIVAISCLVSVAGRDSFRGPKEWALRACAAFCAAALITCAITIPGWLRREWTTMRLPYAAVLTVVGWTAVVTLTSTNTALSRVALLYVAACCVFFVAACAAVRTRGLNIVYAAIAPALANSIVLVLQEARWWDFSALSGPANRTALVGNSNDVGAFLSLAGVAAVALALVQQRRRIVHAALAAVIGFATIMTGSVAAIVAFAAGIVVVAARSSWRVAVTILLTLAITLGALIAAVPAVRSRADRFVTAVATKDYNALTSARLTAFVAAVQMFEQRPLTGVGPGCYPFRYFEEKIRAEARHRSLKSAAERATFFGEAHNDFLQTLAVSGLPGLALLVACLALLARGARSTGEHHDPRKEFARSLSGALPATSAILMMFQFPLELAAPTVMMLFLAALCVGWRRYESA